MNEQPFDVPILLVAFNRPDNTQKIFNEIRKQKPKRFFMAVDGPRSDNPGEDLVCQKTRDIAKQVDWPCEVKTLFQAQNLGCGHGVSTALNWFFENVERGIILEDDCLPDPSFFPFCRELLEKYKDNQKIMHISGDNFQYGKKRGFSSYYFSEYPHIWGWATWRRAWKLYDFNCVPLTARTTNWDRQWWLSVRKHRGLAILPNVNLISNIGFDGTGTHTGKSTHYSNLPIQKIAFPLVHPKIIMCHLFADLFTYRDIFGGSYKNFFRKEFARIIPDKIKPPIKRLLKK
jgi:hypothetical protein